MEKYKSDYIKESEIAVKTSIYRNEKDNNDVVYAVKILMPKNQLESTWYSSEGVLVCYNKALKLLELKYKRCFNL